MIFFNYLNLSEYQYNWLYVFFVYKHVSMNKKSFQFVFLFSRSLKQNQPTTLIAATTTCKNVKNHFVIRVFLSFRMKFVLKPLFLQCCFTVLLVVYVIFCRHFLFLFFTFFFVSCLCLFSLLHYAKVFKLCCLVALYNEQVRF